MTQFILKDFWTHCQYYNKLGETNNKNNFNVDFLLLIQSCVKVMLHTICQNAPCHLHRLRHISTNLDFFFFTCGNGLYNYSPKKKKSIKFIQWEHNISIT